MLEKNVKLLEKRKNDFISRKSEYIENIEKLSAENGDLKVRFGQSENKLNIVLQNSKNQLQKKHEKAGEVLEG